MTGSDKPIITKDGYEVCNAFPGRVLPDSKRYINPKMENELKIFKKKIAARYAGREILNFAFPRVQQESNYQISKSGEQSSQAIRSTLEQTKLQLA